MVESRKWTVEELLGEGSRLAGLFLPKSRVEFMVGGHAGLGRVAAVIWTPKAGSAHGTDLKQVYADSFESAIAKAEAYAAEYVMSNRIMTAEDIGIDVIARAA